MSALPASRVQPAPSAPTTVIGIPTYRRPALLTRLLESLIAEVQGRDVLVIVADNECGEDVPAVVRTFEGRLPGILSVAVSVRGISANRNALVEAAYQHAPHWQRLIMVDDDGLVVPGWLAALMAVADRTGAHVTAGTVEFPLPADVGIFARNGEFGQPRRQPTGVVPMIVGTQNTCFARKVETLLERPWFNVSYGLSGGEDYELFLRLKMSGAVFAWADEALVQEPVPKERVSVRSVLHRSFTAGITNVRAECEHQGWLASAWATGGHLFRVPLALIVHSLLLRKNKVISTVIAGAYTAGRLPGMSRLVRQRYDDATRA
jgi:succinoglycan biosynthesis protein ExoM